MKKAYLLTVALVPLLFLTACAKPYPYEKHLSEVKSDIFCAETDSLSLTLSCIRREHPYASDGIACPASQLIEITLRPKSNADGYRVLLLDTEWGGDMSFRTVEDDWYYSASVGEFPAVAVSLRVEWEGGSEEITATSVKNEDTMSTTEALKIAIEHESETVKRMTRDGEFQGEFRVRLLRRNANYYYVGIVAKDGKTVSLLLGAESGEVLARREG